MSREVRAQKLDSVARCLERLEAKKPASAASLAADPDLQDIVMINLERIVQLCVDVGTLVIAEKGWSPMPSSMGGVFDALHAQGAIPEALRDRMKKSVGFRNLAVHEYDKIDWGIVFKILTSHLDDFRRFGAAMDRL